MFYDTNGELQLSATDQCNTCAHLSEGQSSPCPFIHGLYLDVFYFDAEEVTVSGCKFFEVESKQPRKLRRVQ